MVLPSLAPVFPSRVRQLLGSQALRLALGGLASAALVATARAEPDLSRLLDALRATPEGEWVRVNENSFNSVWTPTYLRPLVGPSPAPPSKIIEAWSGFAWDSNRGDLIIYGGGHANYAGNDVYRWRGTTGLWERASLPSQITLDGAGQDVTVDGPDYAPVSAHTYDNNVFLPNIDRFLTFGGAKYAASGPYTRDRGDGTARRTGPYAFDPARAHPNKVGGLTGSHVKREGAFPEIIGGEMWQNRDMYATIGVPNSDPGGFIETATAVTEENGYDVVYVTGTRGSSQQHLYKYTVRAADDPTFDTMSRVGTYFQSFSGQGAGAYDSKLKLFVRTAGSQFLYWNLNTPGGSNGNKVFVPAVTAGSFTLNTMFGMDYDQARDRYLLWRGDGRVWVLKSPGSISTSGWTIAQQPTPQLPIPSGDHGGRGVLGKWKYIAQLDAFMGLLDPTVGSVWLYKPIGWQDPVGGGSGPLAIMQPNLPAAVVGSPYSAQFVASGGAGGYAWSLAAGSLPPGLALAQDGSLTGTPTVSGHYAFTVQVGDSDAATATRAAAIDVTAPPDPLAYVDFTTRTISSYTNQDAGGSALVDGTGSTVTLTGNTWKRIDLPNQVGPDTYLEFEFQADSQGEIHGIGLEEDNVQSENRLFRVYGTQAWGIPDYANYPGGGAWVSYRIPLGQYYTGAFNYLVLASDDDAGSGAVSRFRNIRVVEGAPPPPAYLNFSTAQISSFANQDVSGTAAVEDAGATLKLSGNTWKRVALSKTITASTVLEFEFSSGDQGEIHGIGVTANNTLDPARVFAVYGTQEWGIRSFANYTGGWVSYSIPIGQYFTGNFSHLVFAMDDDAGTGSESRFRNVRFR